MIKDLQFPLQFTFKISTLANDFRATDAQGKTVAFVHQKLFKLKEEVLVFSNEAKTELLYRIKADRWLDFTTVYTFTDSTGVELGKVARKGWASLWKAHYEIYDQHQQLKFTIREENAWTKVLDGLVGQIPILNLFTGYFLNPSYIVKNGQHNILVRLKKEPSMIGRRFKVEQVQNLTGLEDDQIILGLMMMILLERRRG